MDPGGWSFAKGIYLSEEDRLRILTPEKAGTTVELKVSLIVSALDEEASGNDAYQRLRYVPLMQSFIT